MDIPQRSPSDTDDEPSRRQRARTDHRRRQQARTDQRRRQQARTDQRRRQQARTDHQASKLVNPFLDIDRPASDEELPAPETLDGTRPPAKLLTVALGAQVLTSGQLDMLAEFSHNIPQPEHTTIILSTLAAVLKRLNTLTQKQSPQNPLEPPTAANLSLAKQIRIFQFSPEAKEFLRQQARESMLQPDLEAYTEDTRNCRLFRMVLVSSHLPHSPYSPALTRSPTPPAVCHQ
ncbi:hypothetical protein PGT21_026243 [Puccinia graminis f. sp. tritici]|uniref:Uncharacterized protein n=1 Tax=Puccinia graminis f. sp. tritici TaxID=56615 RepID=A0A5B0LZX8_PUCGR|nr:hypothetical protein PGT21_026243 [Puccinia graminis f. sp. tritici]